MAINKTEKKLGKKSQIKKDEKRKTKDEKQNEDKATSKKPQRGENDINRACNARKKKDEKHNTDNNKESSKSLVDIKAFSSIRIREISADGYFGAEDALTTAIGVGGIAVALMAVFNSIPQAENYKVNILPHYGKPSFLLNLRISLQFNLLIIFFIAFNILAKKIKASLKPKAKAKNEAVS